MNKLEHVVRNRSMPRSTVIPVLAYRDVAAAVEWLCRVFGFRERVRIANHRAQLTFGDGDLIVTDAWKVDAQASVLDAVMLRVADVDSHHAAACAHGATIVNAPADQLFGERQYSALDLAGRRWTFSQSIADSDPASWGGELLE
jgi:uncharacterized glyoxalase superfamily protein PhnB